MEYIILMKNPESRILTNTPFWHYNLIIEQHFCFFLYLIKNFYLTFISFYCILYL